MEEVNMGSTDTSENNVNNLVLSTEMENKLGRLAAAAERVVRFNSYENRQELRWASDDRDIQNWLDGMRNANRAPRMHFDLVSDNREYRG
jgi:hypothetical protein